MEVTWVDTSNQAEPKWRWMITLSLIIHLTAFFVLLFVPESMPTRRLRDTVYEVNLVELPRPKRTKPFKPTPQKPLKKPSMIKKAIPAKRISKPKIEDKPIIIAKRSLAKETKKIEKPKISSSKLLEEALSRIETKVKSKKPDTTNLLDKALNRIEKKVESAREEKHLNQVISRLQEAETSPPAMPEKGPAPIGETTGISIRMYQLEVEDWIKSHWAYPVALSGPTSNKNLETIVLVKVQNNGTIVSSTFKIKSGNIIFDQSVLKAIERSDPLPPFPNGYRKTSEEFEIKFDLKDLEDQ